MEIYIIEEASHFISSDERMQLVRLCAAITHDREAAEDLAQETLLEGLTVVSAYDTYEVLRIYTGGR